MEQQGQEQKALYSTLDPTSRQTRLFTLQPGTFSDPIEGSLAQVSLDDDPDYEALSYVWGDPNVTVPISVDGTEFGVTTNLESALRSLRMMETPRRLWVDAICINQSDVLERNHQVKNMKLVYQAASSVLAWLGKITVSSREGLKVLSNLMENDQNLTDFRDNQGLAAGGKYLVEIFDRDYWKRIWVVQELAFAKRVFLHCGPFSAEIPPHGCLERTTRNLQGFRQINLQGFVKHYLQGLRGLKNQEKRLLAILRLREERLVSRVPPLWELVWQFRHWKRHDPRDMVFALLGLASESDALENHPDYALSMSQVINRLLKSYILRYGDFKILNYADRLLNPGIVPSYVDHWEESDFDNAWDELQALRLVPFNSSKGSQFREFKASGTANSTLIISSDLDPGLLSLRGFVIDRIDYLGVQYQYNPLRLESLPSKGRINRYTIDWVRQAREERVSYNFARHRLLAQWKILREWKLRANQPSESQRSWPLNFLGLGGMPTPEAFWQTITADSLAHQTVMARKRQLASSPKILPGLEPAVTWCGQMIDIITSDELPKNTESFCKGIAGNPGFDDLVLAIELAVARRKFFVSKTSLIGLAPPATCQEDVICIILGGATPFILRPASNGRYEFVGECYVHGIMDGEAMDDLAKGKYKLQDITFM